MKELVEKLIDIKKRIEEGVDALRLTEKEAEYDFLNAEAEKQDFWANVESAKTVQQKINGLVAVIGPWRKMEKEAQELLELLNISKNDEGMIREIETRIAELLRDLKSHETDTYFSGKYDSLSAVLSIYAGAGGVDAQDWAEMLLSMYLKYLEGHKLDASVIHLTPGSEAGIKSVSVEVTGPNAYGLLKSERGVHRLVRISPYDSDKARHTSFALVEVVPELETADMNIPESELKIDTFRASGHGGQSVNTTDSAVRITHLPTGTTVSVQNERSQLQNRETAMKILKARIATAREAEKEKELKIIRGENLAAEWGSQIRSYVIHPYQMVKDHRTGIETSNTVAVLGGELDIFVESYLKNIELGNS